jgi:hypothetical protein
VFQIENAWASGPEDIWAASALLGECFERGVILHWNGKAWSSVTIGDRPLTGIWGRAARDIWAVGTGGAIFHFDGCTWSAVPSGTTQRLLSVWGSAADAVWTGGDDGTMLRWNGATWSSIPIGTNRRIERIWGSGPDNVWAVGGDGALGDGKGDGYGSIFHWNGTAWSSQDAGTKSWLYLGGVWGSGPNDVWAVGATGMTTGAVLHFQP